MRYLLTGLIIALSLPAFGATQTRTSAFAYDPNTGLLVQEVIEPDTPALRLQTDYGYDVYGNKTSVTVSGADIVTRTSTTTFDANGQFPVSSANALGHTETRQYDAHFGTVTSLTGPNQLTTTWQYDGFGRKTLETRADGTTTTWAYNLPGTDAACPSGTAYSTTAPTSGAPTSGTCYDMLNRTLRTYTQGFDGTLAYKDTQYDSLGRVAQVSSPYYAGGTPNWTTYTYDSLGRLLTATDPDLNQTTTGYNGLTTTLTDANGFTTTRIKNSQGQLIQVTDAKNQTTAYSYDPFGNLTQTRDAKNNLTTLTYDLRGRKTDMLDPDMGHWTYQYDVLGQLKTQTDAKGQVTTLTYDKLGRMTSRTEPDLTSGWTYDTAAKGIGKLATVTAGNGFSRSYTYDSLGRPVVVSSTIDTTYTASTTYDAYGRVATYTYPTGFAVKNIYNAQGYLAEVRNNASNALYWQANTKRADGQLQQATLGNGLIDIRDYDAEQRPNSLTVNTAAGSTLFFNFYAYDGVGNLSFRYDSTLNLGESYTYDELNRLMSYYQGGTVIQSYQYDAIGNLTYKSDQGFYSYGAQPHAVTQVTGATATNTYAYDANGNLLSGAGRNVAWNSFNMVYQVTQGKSTLAYTYDADHTRIREIGPNGTTIYLNPRLDSGQHFEKVVNNSGVTEYKNYLYAGGIPVGVYTSRSNGVNDTKYFHTDHLGSITVVTNDSGVVVTRYRYDPFGNRATVAGDPVATEHGFTGHEHMEEVGLINMNGRVYDPALARFMSADPNIQAPGNGQSFNRYSYVMNNPLSLTDPSGYSWLRNFLHNPVQTLENSWHRVERSPIGQVAIAYVSYSVLGPGSWFSPTSWDAANAAIAGAVSGGITGGNLNSALNGAVSAGAFYGAGSFADSQMGSDINGTWGAGGLGRAGAHAVAGCVSASAAGSSCSQGAASAGFTQAFAPQISQLDPDNYGASFERTMAAAIVGGTASVLGGGKFENGAMTGAFSRLYNDEGHLIKWALQAGARLWKPLGITLAAYETEEFVFDKLDAVSQYSYTKEMQENLSKVTAACANVADACNFAKELEQRYYKETGANVQNGVNIVNESYNAVFNHQKDLLKE